ncbi:MAG TPA: carboxypeptidase regulatory-like domain-containing protein [Candidatus Acidoferrum sp.]|nr:carboxypeptidase regulatory-like domain-containing protein [Candidatus Acidoferrum sp.]
MQKTIVLILTSLMLFLSGRAWAQTETGQISGTVLDPQNNVVPNAKITVRNAGTGALRETTSDDHGVFIITNLLPAKYAVMAEAQGFAKLEQQVDLPPGGRVAMDLKLQVGKMGETIEVSATALAVNTENQTVGQLITSNDLTNLPLLTRNPYDLVGGAANVSSAADAGLTMRGAGYNINGLRSAGTNILLDGAANNDEFTASVGQTVPLDSVQEINVLTNNFTAEYGRASAGVVNVTTKSGTNDFHGTAYEFGRYAALAANTFDNNARGIAKPGFTRNQFGYSVGGPIVKDKLFFFQSTEWLRVRSSATSIINVPTPQLIAAANSNTQQFFSAFGTLRSNFVQLKTYTRDQLTAAKITACPPAPSICDTDFPVGSTRPMFAQGQYSVASDSGAGFPQNTYYIVGRADWNVTSKTQLYGRYALEKGNLFTGTVTNSPYVGYDSGQATTNNSFLLSLIHTFSPKLTSQSKIVFNRLNLLQPLGANPVGPTLYMNSTSAPKIEGNLIGMPGYSPFTPGNAIPFGGPQNFVQAYQDLSSVHGRHTFRFGGNYTYIRDNRSFGAYQEAVESLSATTTFSTSIENFLNGVLGQFQSAIDPQGKFPCGAAGAVPNCTVTLPVGPPVFARSNRYHEFGTYFEDSWKATNRLTFNLGMRWDYFGVQHNKDPNLDSNYYDAQGGNIFTNIRNGSVATVPNSPIHGLWKKDWNNFGPRLGVAYDLFGNGKTALRGGWGISYERNFGNVTFNVIQNPPAYTVISILPNDVGGTIPITTDNAGPLGGSTGSKPIPKASLRNVDPNIVTAYAHLWSAVLEHQMTRNFIMAVEYNGSKGVDLYSIENPNRPGAGNVYLGDPCPTTPCAVANLTRLQNFQYSNINRRGDNGFSHYNSVAARVELTNLGNTGLSLHSSYTYAHAIDNISSTFSESNNNANLGLLDPFNPKIDKGNSDFDLRHRFVFSGTWDVPFARNMTGAAKGFLDGWTAAPIITIRGGFPFTLFDCTNALTTCMRAVQTSPHSKTGSAVPDPSGAANTFDYFNFSSGFDSSYINPIAGVSDFGPFPKNMLTRGYFYGPGAYTIDLGVYKTTKINERLSLQIRGEFFNLLNHSNMWLTLSDNDLSSTTTVHAQKGVPPINADERRNVQLAVKLIF